MNVYVRKNELDIYKYLDDKEIELLNSTGEYIIYESDDKIYSEGDKDQDTFCILFGEVIIYKSYNQEQQIIHKLHKGEVFGESNLVFRKRKFTAKTTKRSKVIRFHYKEFTKLLKGDDILSAKVNAAINDTLTEKQMRITYKLSSKVI